MTRLWRDQAPVVEAARQELEVGVKGVDGWLIGCSLKVRCGHVSRRGSAAAGRSATPVLKYRSLRPPVVLPPCVRHAQAKLTGDPYLRARTDGVRVEVARKALYRSAKPKSCFCFVVPGC